MSERALQIPDSFREIVREPNWYERLSSLRGGLMLGAMAARNTVEFRGATGGVRGRTSRLLVRAFTELMKEGAVNLGVAGPNWDADRQAVDTIVVHHTSRPPGIDLHELNALHLLNLYVPKYQHPGEDAEEIGGLPIYSGHFDADGRPVFYGYHWLVREDGSHVRLLPDAAIGWQAGDWDVNTRSVAVCFDDDLEDARPSQPALNAAVEVIAEHYPQVALARILGHSAVVQTVCPGKQFDHWGEELRALVEAKTA